MQQTKGKIPISERAVMARINRKLAKEGREGKQLIKTPSKKPNFPYFVVDKGSGRLGANVSDLETFGRKLGVLRPWETVNGLRTLRQK